VTLIPDRAGYGPADEVVVELDRPAERHGELVVTHLAEVVRRVPVVAGDTSVAVGAFARGGYGVRLGDDTTAFDVLDDPFERPRYGFVVRLTDPDRTAPVTRTFRRLHLTAALLYDWAYRHSTLLPPERLYVDPLGAERDLEVVNDLSRSLDAAGTLPLGYSAVYAIGSAELADWPDSVLLRSDGEPYRLGDDFLVLVDPIEPTWLAHYLDELEGVLAATALRGFHLDQYGWPKFARRSDGERVDLAESYRVLLDAVRERMPTARFMFNNVNDFGTAETATTGQDASYIEVWPPHSTLDDLVLLAARTRAYRPEHPPIFAAYLSCFDSEPEERAVAAAELVMATVFAAGATHLLLGEDSAALTDPYYVRHHELTPAALDALVPWYDFAVRYGDLLYDPAAVDVTEFYTGGINGDVVVECDVTASTKADAGTIWMRVVRTDAGLVVHLVDLAAQSETHWDAGKTPGVPRSGLRVGFAPVAPTSTVQFATVDAPDLVELVATGVGTSEQSDALSAAQSSAWFELPPFRVWAMIVIPTESLG
jgi:dextranase